MPLDSVAAQLTPQQLAADPDVSAFVTANAGSGKTSTLVNRVARLLLRGAAPEAVLCVTYTKAAAAEMQRRLFETLGGWAVTGDADLRRKLADLGEDPRETSPARARALFARALETPGGLKIQTIHAFCEKLLRRFPLEAGVSPGFQVAEDAAQLALSADARTALARLVLSEPGGPVALAYEHFAIELAHNHFDALLKTLEGKRDRIAALLADPDAEAAIWRNCGFADGQAVLPEQVRADAALPPQLDLDVWRAAAACFEQGTASDVKCAELLRAVIVHAGEGRADFEAAWCALHNKDGTPRWAKKPPRCLQTSGLGAALAVEQDRLAVARERACAATVARDTVNALVLGHAYGRAYDLLKSQRGLLDFSDLVTRTVQLLTDRADAAWVLFKLDGGIDHVLVDEAQDTAPEQWDILRRLTEEFFAGAGAPARRGRAGPDNTVFAVGDEKQSIYSFQGARPERLRSELLEYDALVTGAGRVFKAPILADSWRSTSEVLRFVDAVFADPSTRQGVPAPVGQDVVEHKARRLDHGCVDLWSLIADEAVAEREAWDAPLDAETSESARKRLARRMALEIKASVARGEAVQDKATRQPRAARYSDFLILVRRRDALFEEIIRALKKAGVPVGGADRLRLSDHILTDDLLALARVALFPGDDLSLAALLRSPFFDVDEDGLYALARGRESSLWRALRTRAEERPEWAAAYRVLNAAMNGAGAAQPYEFYARFLAPTDELGRSMTARVLTRLGLEARDALDAFLGEAIAAEARGVHGLEAFASALERSELEVKREQEDVAGDGPGEVRVMTVHGAKGLEAPVVFLPDTTVRAKPQGPALLDDGAGGYLYAPRKGDDCAASTAARTLREERTDQESLRLLYVGLTRARDRLVICGRGVRGKPEPEPGSGYDRCRTGFAQAGIDGRTLETPDGLGVVRFGPDPAVASRTGVVPAEIALPDWARRPARPESAAAAYASPSQLAERRRGAAPSPLAETRGVGRFRRGDLIHHLLQVLPDLAPAARGEAAATLLAKHRDLAPEQRAEMTAAALGVLEDPRFAEVFGPGSRAEAAVAGTAPDLPPGLAVSGRVDRLTVTPERVLVVDFKTNRPSPDRVEDADPAYLQQMAVYVAVLRAVFPGRRVEAALVWTDGPKLMPIPEELVAATLAGLPRAA